MSRFKVGDRVTVRDVPSLFHTRTQGYTRSQTGVVVALRPEWVIPEDEAWGRYEGRREPFYMVRFNLRDLWPDYGGAPIDTVETSSRFLETAIRELSIAKGLLSAEDHRRFMEWYDKIGPTHGARVVARAWVDPDFKERLLADGVAACKELGIDWMQLTGFGTPSDYTYLIVCEDTPKIHNAIVCTLCSCYPRPLLGTSPAWYERSNYRRRRSAGPARSLRSLAPSSRRTSRYASMIRTRKRATWCFRCARAAPKAGAKSSSPPSSPGIL